MTRLTPALLLTCAAGLPAATQEAFWTQVSWATPDGIQLVGLYHASNPAPSCTWVLLPGLGSIKEEWDGFAKKMAAQGAGILLYDPRGHGESTRSAAGESLHYQDWPYSGPGTPWDAMPSDLASAVQYLQKTHRIAIRSIAVGGASLGANVALRYASQQPEITALLLLSPGLEYAGIQSSDAYRRYRDRPLFMAASPADLYAYSSVRELNAQFPNKQAVIAEGPGNAHGVNMFQDPVFEKKVLAWMKGVGWK